MIRYHLLKCIGQKYTIINFLPKKTFVLFVDINLVCGPIKEGFEDH